MKNNFLILNNKQDKYEILAYDQTFPCQIGSNGVISSKQKKEGDLSTPKRKRFLTSVFFREDTFAFD